MTRRCKPGQRARIISGRDTGQIVVVVRPYFGEQVARGTWPVPIYPWVVASLSGLLGSVNLDTGKENPPDRMAVYDDCDLEPLDDNDDGFDESTDTPVKRPAVKSVDGRREKSFS
jgi:hypothetical protein